MRRLMIPLALVAAALGFSACGDSSNNPSNQKPVITSCKPVDNAVFDKQSVSSAYVEVQAEDPDGDDVETSVAICDTNGQNCWDVASGTDISLDDLLGNYRVRCTAEDQEFVITEYNDFSVKDSSGIEIDRGSVSIAFGGNTFGPDDAIVYRLGEDSDDIVIGFTAPGNDNRIKFGDYTIFQGSDSEPEGDFNPNEDCEGPCDAGSYDIEVESCADGECDSIVVGVDVEAQGNHAPELQSYRLNSVNTGQNMSIFFVPFDPEDDLMTYSIESFQPSDLEDVRARGPPDYEGFIGNSIEIPNAAVGPAQIVLKICDDKQACSTNNIDFTIDQFESYLTFIDESDNDYVVRGGNGFVAAVMDPVGHFKLEDNSGGGGSVYEANNVANPDELNAALQSYVSNSSMAEHYNQNYETIVSELTDLINASQIKILQARVIQH